MITPFNPSVIERAIEVVRRSGADVKLLTLLSPRGRGRRPSYNTTAFLVGALLAVQWKGSVVVRDIHRVLTQRLPLNIQRELGVRFTNKSGERTIAEKHLYGITEAIGRYIEYGTGSEPDLDDEERERRRTELLDLLHCMLAVTLPQSSSVSRAIDSTGIWSYGKSPRSAPKELLRRDANDEPLEDDKTCTENVDGANDETEKAQKRPSDPDADHGVKTRKDGKRETYYGYELHALVRVPDHPEQEVIPLFETFEVTPAGKDVVGPSLDLIDRAKAMGNKILDLLADRHYSYKTEDRWFFELLRRGIRQHVDLHPNDQGFRDYNGMKLAAAWPHCPCTPDRLGRIDSPSPNADAATKHRFEESIAEREQYALRRVNRLSETSGARWECPAVDGRVGCPLREGTVEIAQLNGLPVIIHPPARATAPACCTQRTVSTGRDAQPKVEQEHYWGSSRWKKRYNARTYVEGAFGNMKNPTTENVERGFFQVTGLAKVNFMVGIALVAHNLRILRGNSPLSESGEGDILLQQDAECHGFMFVTPEEEAFIVELRGRQLPGTDTAPAVPAA